MRNEGQDRLVPLSASEADCVATMSRSAANNIIPAGLPHGLSEIDGPMSYTIYRFETTQPR